MGIQGGLRPADWKHWGEWTTFKRNAAALLARSLRAGQVIYCSPLTDPYQPAEEDQAIMREILETLASANADRRPKAFVIQTRGPLILRDLDLLTRLPNVRVSFSISTDREDVRRIFESHCASVEERFDVVLRLTAAGIRTSIAIAPILPCDPVRLIERACQVSNGPIACDPLHTRSNKASGATTRTAAVKIAEHHGWQQWFDVDFQQEVVRQMQETCRTIGRDFGLGPKGFGLLATAQ